MHRTVLGDEQGPALEYDRSDRRGGATADVAEIAPGRTAQEAAAVACAQLPGWRITTADPSLSDALVAAGAEFRRRALIMQCRLAEGASREPDLRPFEARPLPSTTSDPALWAPILPSWRAAFPPGHPDHLDVDEAGALAFFAPLIDGTEMGPLHRSTCVVADPDGRVGAGIVVNVRSRDARAGGPWISDIWRDPGLRGTGIGARLIERAQHQLAADGFTTLTLAVTRGNNAERSYSAAGFTLLMDSRILVIPGEAG